MLYRLAANLPGALSITARPGTPPDDLVTLQQAGVTTVVSLLEPEEAAGLNLATQADSCKKLGLTFLNHPIRDMQLPDPQAFATFADHVAKRLRAGQHAAVHCRASIGRSGMLACTVLGHFGYTAETALAHVSKMRGVPVPDTAEQTAFIQTIMANRP